MDKLILFAADTIQDIRTGMMGRKGNRWTVCQTAWIYVLLTCSCLHILLGISDLRYYAI